MQFYTIKIHALKSSSLSVGAENLSKQAKEMEMAGKAGQYDVISNQHESAMKLYGQVVADIEKYLREKGYFSKQESEFLPQDLNDISMETFLEMADYIIEACENFDGDEANQKAEELCLCKLDGKSLAEYFVKVKTYIGDYEYEQAIDSVKKAVESIQEEAG